VVSATACVPTGWAKLGNVSLDNITLGIVTFGEVVVGHIVESATVATTRTLYTGETSDTLGVVVYIMDVNNDKVGGNFGNGLFRAECEALFLGDERVTIAGTFCVFLIFFIDDGTVKALGTATLVIFILFVVILCMVASPFFFTVLALPLLVPFFIGSGFSLNFGDMTINPSL
jgi:hypothetical protein